MVSVNDLVSSSNLLKITGAWLVCCLWEGLGGQLGFYMVKLFPLWKQLTPLWKSHDTWQPHTRVGLCFNWGDILISIILINANANANHSHWVFSQLKKYLQVTADKSHVTRSREEGGALRNPSPPSLPAVALIEILSKGGAPSLRNVLSFGIEFERGGSHQAN